MYILKRTPEEIVELAKNIKPVAKIKLMGKSFSNGGLFYFKAEEISSYVNLKKKGTPLCKADCLVKIATIDTFHSQVGWDMSFQPTTEQVLDQIPEEYFGKVVAFSVKQPNMTPEENLDPNLSLIRGTTTLYGLKDGWRVPERVKTQPVIYKGNKIFQNDVKGRSK